MIEYISTAALARRCGVNTKAMRYWLTTKEEPLGLAVHFAVIGGKRVLFVTPGTADRIVKN